MDNHGPVDDEKHVLLRVVEESKVLQSLLKILLKVVLMTAEVVFSIVVAFVVENSQRNTLIALLL